MNFRVHCDLTFTITVPILVDFVFDEAFDTVDVFEHGAFVQVLLIFLYVETIFQCSIIIRMKFWPFFFFVFSQVLKFKKISGFPKLLIHPGTLLLLLNSIDMEFAKLPATSLLNFFSNFLLFNILEKVDKFWFKKLLRSFNKMIKFNDFIL